ncbi:MAG: hypothetical protein ACO3DS_08810, partial [Phycisphaerales bacterium]
PRRPRSGSGGARMSGIGVGVLAIGLSGVTMAGIVMRSVPSTTAVEAAPSVSIVAADGGSEHSRLRGVVIEHDGRMMAVTSLGGLRMLRSAGVERVTIEPAVRGAGDTTQQPLLLAIEDAMVRTDALDRWIDGSPAGKGEDAWAAVGGGSMVDLAWWPLPASEGLSPASIADAPGAGAELAAAAAGGSAVGARCRTLAPQPAAFALQATAGAPPVDPGTPWFDAAGGVAALTIGSPGIDERTRRGVATPASWSDLHAMPLAPMRALADPMSNQAKPLRTVIEATLARATQPAAAERAARLQWLLAASASERFAALAPAIDRLSTLPSSATTIELEPRPVDGEARVIVWPELSDMIELDAVSPDPALRLVPVPGLRGRVLDVRDGSGQPAVLPAGRPVSVSIRMTLLGRAIGGPVRAMLLGRDADSSVGQRRISGGPPPTAPPAPSPSATPTPPPGPTPTPAPSPTPAATPPPAQTPTTTPAPTPTPAPTQSPAPAAPPAAPAPQQPTPGSTP